MEEKEEKDKKYPHTIEEIDAFWKEKARLEHELVVAMNKGNNKLAYEYSDAISKLMDNYLKS